MHIKLGVTSEELIFNELPLNTCTRQAFVLALSLFLAPHALQKSLFTHLPTITRCVTMISIKLSIDLRMFVCPSVRRWKISRKHAAEKMQPSPLNLVETLQVLIRRLVLKTGQIGRTALLQYKANCKFLSFLNMVFYSLLTNAINAHKSSKICTCIV